MLLDKHFFAIYNVDTFAQVLYFAALQIVDDSSHSGFGFNLLNASAVLDNVLECNSLDIPAVGINEVACRYL